MFIFITLFHLLQCKHEKRSQDQSTEGIAEKCQAISQWTSSLKVLTNSNKTGCVSQANTTSYQNPDSDVRQPWNLKQKSKYLACSSFLNGFFVSLYENSKRFMKEDVNYQTSMKCKSMALAHC